MPTPRKTRRLRVLGVLVGAELCLLAMSPRCASAADDPAGFKLAPLRKVSPKRLPPPSAAERAHIEHLIAKLADTTTADLGLSTVVGGMRLFPPLDQHQPPSTLLELIKRGPLAFGALLAHLDDRSPTKAVIRPEGIITAVVATSGLTDAGNPLDPQERNAVAKVPASTDEQSISGFTLKIGDLCYAAIGQIVGRRYVPVRYQPSGILVVTPLTEKPYMVQAIRRAWSSVNPRLTLFDSLVRDFRTRSAKGRGGREWIVSSDLQEKAAPRLLYYFPRESGTLIADRVRGLRCGSRAPLRASAEDDWARFVRRETLNGVDTDAFLGSIVRCQVKEVQHALEEVFWKSGDYAIAGITLAAVPNSKARRIRRKLEPMLGRRQADFNEDEALLRDIVQRCPSEAHDVFRRYLEKYAAADRRLQAAFALGMEKPQWGVAPLLSMLSDQRRPAGVTEGLRVCDFAAENLTSIRPKLVFDSNNAVEQRDLQIDEMRRKLKGQ